MTTVSKLIRNFSSLAGSLMHQFSQGSPTPRISSSGAWLTVLFPRVLECCCAPSQQRLRSIPGHHHAQPTVGTCQSNYWFPRAGLQVGILVRVESTDTPQGDAVPVRGTLSMPGKCWSVPSHAWYGTHYCLEDWRALLVAHTGAIRAECGLGPKPCGDDRQHSQNMEG